jgi:hypothetical protein
MEAKMIKKALLSPKSYNANAGKTICAKAIGAERSP